MLQLHTHYIFYEKKICIDDKMGQKREKKMRFNKIYNYKITFIAINSLFLRVIKRNTMSKMNDLNRIKVVLVEKKRTNKWLAETLGKNPATVSKWCTNTSQPDLATLLQIAELLEVDIKELLANYKN